MVDIEWPLHAHNNSVGAIKMWPKLFYFPDLLATAAAPLLNHVRQYFQVSAAVVASCPPAPCPFVLPLDPRRFSGDFAVDLHAVY